MKYTLICILCFFVTQVVYSYGGILIGFGTMLLLSWLPFKYRSGLAARITSFIQLGLTIFIGYYIFKVAYGEYVTSIIPLILSTIHLIVPLKRDLSIANNTIKASDEALLKFPKIDSFAENLIAHQALKIKFNWTIFLIIIAYLAYFGISKEASMP